MSEWKPIASIPKDGTDVLLHCKDGILCAGRYSAGHGCVNAQNCWELTPTHWQPHPGPIPAKHDFGKKLCSRYTNATCMATACLERGGWNGCQPVDYNMATCEAHELVCDVEKNQETMLKMHSEIERTIRQLTDVVEDVVTIKLKDEIVLKVMDNLKKLL